MFFRMVSSAASESSSNRSERPWKKRTFRVDRLSSPVLSTLLPLAGLVTTVLTCATPARATVNFESPIRNASSLIRTFWYFTVAPL